jgi:succinoglycan biosynthesis protein ExoW
MINVAVIIPFFQRQPGILRRALLSILQQRLPPGIAVKVCVVDDGSPISAQSEAEGLEFAPPFHLTIVPQPNAGVAAARNRGLGTVDVDTTYIAFLDSDDMWHEGHLHQGVGAL